MIGFLVTFWNLKKVKREVERTRVAIYRYDAVAELTSVLTLMEEMKRLHREGHWLIVLPQYSELRRKVVGLRNGSDLWSLQHQVILQDAVGVFRSLEVLVERALSLEEVRLDYIRMNQVITDQMDRLEGILAFVKRGVG